MGLSEVETLVLFDVSLEAFVLFDPSGSARSSGADVESSLRLTFANSPPGPQGQTRITGPGIAPPATGRDLYLVEWRDFRSPSVEDQILEYNIILDGGTSFTGDVIAISSSTGGGDFVQHIINRRGDFVQQVFSEL